MFEPSSNGKFEDINSVTSANSNDTTLDVRDLATVIMPATNSSAPALPVMQNSGDTQLARKYNREGEAVYKTGQPEQAIRLLRQAIELDGNYGQTLSNLGLAYQEGGNIAEAVQANRKAISLACRADAATTCADSYYNVVRIYGIIGQDTDALQHYQLALHDVILQQRKWSHIFKSYILVCFSGGVIHHLLLYYLKDGGNRRFFNDNKTYSYAI